MTFFRVCSQLFFSQTVFGILYHRDLVVDRAKRGDSTPAHRNKVFTYLKPFRYFFAVQLASRLSSSQLRAQQAGLRIHTNRSPAPLHQAALVPTRAEKICTYIALYTISYQKAKKQTNRTGPRTPPPFRSRFFYDFVFLLLLAISSHGPPTFALPPFSTHAPRCGTLLLSPSLPSRLVQAASGHETTVAFAAFLLERLVDALASAEATKPRRYYFRGSGSGRKGLENPGKQAGSGASSSGDGLKTAKLQSIVLTKNRDIAASVTVSFGVRYLYADNNRALPLRGAVCGLACIWVTRREEHTQEQTAKLEALFVISFRGPCCCCFG